MSFCTKCGKQNIDTAKFCTGCGAALISKTVRAVSAPEQKNAEYEKLFGKPPAKKKNVWIIISIITFLGLAAGGYFIFFNKKKNVTDTKSANMDTVSVTPATEQTYIQPADTTARYPTASTTVPLNPGNTNTEITQTEVDAVSAELRNFYQCENDEDVACLLGRYSFPVSRYYQLYNVSYEALHKLFTESFNEKLSYHHITIKWDYCTIQKIYDGYKAVLYADYEFVRSATPDENRSRSIQIIIHLNSSYHITTIYENQ